MNHVKVNGLNGGQDEDEFSDTFDEITNVIICSLTLLLYLIIFYFSEGPEPSNLSS